MSALTVFLPGVVSWARPRNQRGRRRPDGTYRRGGVRYPEQYELARTAWTLVVEQAVAAAGWTAPAGRVSVAVTIYGRGGYDPDRVFTACLDVAQAGGAIKSDHRRHIGELHLVDCRPARGEPARTEVSISLLEAHSCIRSGDRIGIETHQDAPTRARVTRTSPNQQPPAIMLGCAPGAEKPPSPQHAHTLVNAGEQEEADSNEFAGRAEIGPTTP